MIYNGYINGHDIKRGPICSYLHVGNKCIWVIVFDYNFLISVVIGHVNDE